LGEKVTHKKKHLRYTKEEIARIMKVIKENIKTEIISIDSFNNKKQKQKEK
jgi:hypothetical protein|tara:strand:+ start:240 stop:392 length:153 start_codon:yes stop_codon:yes gene_type:complete